VIAPLLALGCGAFVGHFLAGGLPSGTSLGYSLEVRRPLAVAAVESVEPLPLGFESNRSTGTLRLQYPRYPQVAGRLEGDLEIGTRGDEVELLLNGTQQPASCLGDRLLYATADDVLIILELDEPRAN
jgi:hypothetical protein